MIGLSVVTRGTRAPISPVIGISTRSRISGNPGNITNRLAIR